MQSLLIRLLPTLQRPRSINFYAFPLASYLLRFLFPSSPLVFSLSLPPICCLSLFPSQPSALRKTQPPTLSSNKAAASTSFPPPALPLPPCSAFHPLLPSCACSPDSVSLFFSLSLSLSLSSFTISLYLLPFCAPSSNPPSYPKAPLPQESQASLALSSPRHCCYRFGLGNVFFFGYFVATAGYDCYRSTG